MTAETPQPQNSFRDLLHQGNYLGAVRVLKQERWPDDGTRLQYLSWALGAVGCYREAQRAFNTAMGEREMPPPPSAEQWKALEQIPLQPAEEVVLSAAEEHQIVILNEAHHQPEHRAFASRLIPKLVAAGAQYFALEAGSQTALLDAMRTGCVREGTDPYSFEPQRAELLRAVFRSGLKPVAIDFRTPEEEAEMREHPEESMPIREASMARNVEEQILSRDPNARILIWVGFHHAHKRASRGDGWMAARLWRGAGIEPFSIYQMSDSGDPAHDEPIYRLRVKFARRPLHAPMAVRFPLATLAGELPDELRGNPIYKQMAERGLDAVILHPPHPFELPGELPAWLQPEGGADIEGEVVYGGTPCAGHLVQALIEDEGDRSTPAGQVLTDDRGRFHLRVRPGRYSLRVWAPAGDTPGERIVATFPPITCGARQTLWRVISVRQG